MRSKIQVDDWSKAILFLILLIQLLFINGLYLITCTLCFLVIIYNLQQPHKTSVFSILLIYHFVQIISGVILSTYLGIDINAFTANMGPATLLSLIGLICLFSPIIYFQNKMPAINFGTLKKHSYQLSINRTYYAYIVAFVVVFLLTAIQFFYAGFAQVITSIIKIKWFFFLIFGFQSLIKKKRRKEFYLFILIEILIGFASFFSEFKTVLLFVSVIYLTFLVEITRKRMIAAIFFGSMLVIAMLFWTSIKSEYRAFLNKGSSTQSVQVSKNEALTKLYEISSSRQNSSYGSATSTLLERLAATQNFALTISRVPSIIPFQNGNNLYQTLQFTLTPRLLNPNKRVIDFSEKVSKYTGIAHAGMTQGTSFSLGYFVDCYIDFGAFGMMIPLLLLGFIYGYIYFHIIKHSSKNFIINYSLACSLFMEFYAVEMDLTYLIGRFFASLLVFFLFQKFFFTSLVRYLSVPDKD